MRSMNCYLWILSVWMFACGVFAVNAYEGNKYALLSEAAQTFSAANEATGEQARELYIKAAELYKMIAEEAGVENPKLFYNIGNSYLLAEDLGRAIFYYKKALKLDSTDPQLNHNLAVARSKRLDKIDVQTEKKVLSTLFFWHYDFSLRTRFLVFIMAFTTITVISTIRIWLPGFGAFVPLLIVLSLLLCCSAASVAVEIYNNAVRIEGVVVAKEVVARKGDSERYERAFTQPLHSGTEFVVIEKRPQWLNVQLADGAKIWLPEDSCLIDVK